MGRDKASIEVEGIPLLLRTLQSLEAVPVTSLLVVGRTGFPGASRDVRFIPDERPGAGPLAGLLTAARHAGRAHFLLVACDMPWLQTDLLRRLVELSAGQDAVVPHWAGKLQPLCAVYSASVAGEAKALLDRGERSLTACVEALPNVRWLTEDEVRAYDPQGLSFLNVNTPYDLDRASAYSPHR